jgi:hypothetical protein
MERVTTPARPSEITRPPKRHVLAARWAVGGSERFNAAADDDEDLWWVDRAVEPPPPPGPPARHLALVSATASGAVRFRREFTWTHPYNPAAAEPPVVCGERVLLLWRRSVDVSPGATVELQLEARSRADGSLLWSHDLLATSKRMPAAYHHGPFATLPCRGEGCVALCLSGVSDTGGLEKEHRYVVRLDPATGALLGWTESDGRGALLADAAGDLYQGGGRFVAYGADGAPRLAIADAYGLPLLAVGCGFAVLSGPTGVPRSAMTRFRRTADGSIAVNLPYASRRALLSRGRAVLLVDETSVGGSARVVALDLATLRVAWERVLGAAVYPERLRVGDPVLTRNGSVLLSVQRENEAAGSATSPRLLLVDARGRAVTLGTLGGGGVLDDATALLTGRWVTRAVLDGAAEVRAYAVPGRATRRRGFTTARASLARDGRER